MNKCSVEDCKKDVHGQGLCSMHYTRKRRYGTTDKPLLKSEILLTEGKAYCCSCKQEKLIEDFGNDFTTPHGLARRCRSCYSLKGKKRYKENKHKHQDYKRKKKFGLGKLEYQKLLMAQNNTCAICGIKFPKGKDPSVDHDHKTGIVRGLLCSNCNLGLGHFKDDIEVFLKAIQYLKLHEDCACIG